MKVEYIKGKSGFRFSINVGDVENVSDEKGKRLLKIGHAVIAEKDAVANVVIPGEVKKMAKKRSDNKASKKK